MGLQQKIYYYEGLYPGPGTEMLALSVEICPPVLPASSCISSGKACCSQFASRGHGGSGC